jgi:hypothetical protein
MHVAKAEPNADLDMSRCFLPEALADIVASRGLDAAERRCLNQVRAFAYLHLFDTFEKAVASVARARARYDVDTRDTLAPLLRLDAFDHHELFRSFESAFDAVFPVKARGVPLPTAFVQTLEHASPLAILVLALHLKMVTQQHYLACVRGDEVLEPHFVKLLKDHWTLECGTSQATVPITTALSKALPGRVPAALRDYRLLVFACDDVLHAQAALDIETFVAAIPRTLSESERASALALQLAAHRKTFLTVGIVNAGFVYAMRSLGPTAPSMLAGVVSALAARA